jgi:hypothetical protein
MRTSKEVLKKGACPARWRYTRQGAREREAIGQEQFVTPFFLHAHFLTFIPILSLFTHARRFATPKIDGHWGDWARKVDRAPDKTKLLIGEGIFFQKKKRKNSTPNLDVFRRLSLAYALAGGGGAAPPPRPSGARGSENASG